MKSLVKNKKQPSHLTENIDIDVTPIMNMFIILIPFLVSMAVFAHLSVLPFTLPPSAGVGSGGPKKEDLKLTVAMNAEGYMLTLGENVLDSIPLTGGEYDFAALTEALATKREDLKHKDEIVLAVNDGVIFDNVVSSMDHCRDAGFTKIGLAGGNTKTAPVNGDREE